MLYVIHIQSNGADDMVAMVDPRFLWWREEVLQSGACSERIALLYTTSNICLMLTINTKSE